ncbi:hypothetical protein [Desulfoferrobacter suflitae]|uniref:hypothetical protein n=1 Tax=Desulfoferrobacter suflitae TaxID=2865782 RepID=UPI0021641A16|nr:hypothetical protein [Desulfoferrobacter suflitae]MCK8603790.1 hypothetical protein [Desulfoferrobacter suflitae]
MKSAKQKRELITSDELLERLKGLKIKLDCGHCCTVGHQLANTLVVTSTGGGKIRTYCHECYN